MILHSWRIVKARYADVAFAGTGARLAGGRWNTPGTPMIYTAGSISLAILEMLVHIQSTDVLSHYVTFELSLDGALVDRPAAGDLPSNWFRSPAPAATRNLGDAWIRRGQSPVLEVPSAIVRTEWNYLINPDHPDFARIAVAPPRPITLDRRLG